MTMLRCPNPPPGHEIFDYTWVYFSNSACVPDMFHITVRLTKE